MAEKMTHAEVRLATAALDALGAVDDVLLPPRSALAKAAPSALYAYVTDPGYEPDDNLRRLLEADAGAQADVQRMVENTAIYHMPRMAAASSGEISSREASGCRIVFRPSRADAEQIYAIVEIADTDARPTMLFVKHPDGRLDRLELPDFRDGRAQLLLERGAPAARGLMDINTEVYVK